MEGELHKESIFCDAQLLTTYMLSAKGPTLNCDLSIFGWASFVDWSKNCRKGIVIMKFFVWLLQRVAEILRNLVVIASWPTLRRRWLGIFCMVRVVSFKIFELSFCKKKKIPLSRRIRVCYGRVNQWVSEWEMYVCHTNEIGSTVNSQSNFLL